MLEACADQGAGLRHLGMNSTTRVIAVTSHGSHQSELALLWCICSALIELGYAVTVLDGTLEEQECEPGLLQILDSQHWQLGADVDQGTWSVLAAAMGLSKICHPQESQGQPLQRLSSLFESGQVVVVFARGDLLAKLLEGSNVQPLLAVSSSPMSLMTAYYSLKQMHITAQIHPLIVSIEQEYISRINNTQTPGETLYDCARNFLDCTLSPPLIANLNTEDGISPEMNRLITRMLATAMPIVRHLQTAQMSRGTQPRALFSGSH